MKVALVDIDLNRWNPELFVKGSVLEPYAIECLGAFLKKENIDVILLQFDKESVQEIAQTILSHRPNIVGFSVLTKSYNISRIVAQEIKKQAPDTLIIFGGYHPSAMPEIVENKEIDIVVIGEGEATLLDIVKAFEKKNTYEAINGIAYWKEGLRINPPRARIKELDSLPWPIRVREWLGKSKVAQPIYPAEAGQRNVVQINYSRGCSYSCAFCCSPKLWQKKVFWRSAKELVKEVGYLKTNYDINLLYFTDLSFNINLKKVYELCHEFIEQKVKIGWTADCRFLPNIPFDFFEIMAKAGCSRIAWGLESVSDMTLSKIRKNQSLDLARQILEMSNQVGILNRVFVIIGFPWETREYLINLPEVLKTLPIDSVRIAVLTPFPGTPLWKRFKNSLKINDFNHFTTDEPVLSLNGIKNEDLTEIRQMIVKKFYNSPEYEKHWRTKVSNFPYLKKSFDEFFEFLHKYNVLS